MIFLLKDLHTLQLQNLVKKVDLEPGVIYKLRIAAVNSCGRGPWSEAAAFKTCLPGAPPAPSNIKITKVCNEALEKSVSQQTTTMKRISSMRKISVT